MRGWQANKKRTCALPVVLGLCPKRKYPRFAGGYLFMPGTQDSTESFPQSEELRPEIFQNMQEK